MLNSLWSQVIFFGMHFAFSVFSFLLFVSFVTLPLFRAADKMGETHFVGFAYFALEFARKVWQKSLGSVVPLRLIGSSQLVHGGSTLNRLKLVLKFSDGVCVRVRSQKSFLHNHPAIFQFLSSL